MTITMPTAALVGLLNDVTPFAHPDPESSLNRVCLEWDGEMLHALSTDLVRIAISSWHPDDDTSGGGQLAVVNPFGSGDARWAVLLTVDNADQIAKKFKLSDKISSLPVSVSVVDQSRLTVRRERLGGLMGIRVDVDGVDEEFPDVRAELSEYDRLEPVRGITFNNIFFADFGKVRARGGVMELLFCGTTGLTHVRIGHRFVGSIRPTTVPAKRPRMSGAGTGDL